MLDTLAIMLMTSISIWYFLLSSVLVVESWLEAAMVLVGLASCVGILFVGFGLLVADHHPPFVPLLVAGLSLFLLSEVLYLFFYPELLYRAGDWPEVLWSVGLVFAGLSALRAGPVGFTSPIRFRPRETFLVWVGPLSPALQLGCVLLWGALYPPLPAYALVGGALVLAILAVRTAVNNSVNWYLSVEQEMEAQVAERQRIAVDLHDTVKQSLIGSSFSLKAVLKHLDRGERAAARNATREVLEDQHQNVYQVKAIIRELQPTGQDVSLPKLLEQLEEDIEARFGIRTHRDLRAGWEELSVEERVTAGRIASEALWNAAKHSGARNIWVGFCDLEGGVLLEIRDDGRGLPPEEELRGYGLPIMRSRAQEIGAGLEVHSAVGEGTTICLRLHRR